MKKEEKKEQQAAVPQDGERVMTIAWGVKDGQPWARSGGTFPTNPVMLEGVLGVAREQYRALWERNMVMKDGKLVTATKDMLNAAKDKIKSIAN